MGKRINRYFLNTIPNIIPSIIGKSISLITLDGCAFYGKIITLQNNTIHFEDKIPRLHHIDLKNIYEIVLDSEASH